MANIKISNEQYNRLFNKNKEIVISESQYNRVFSLLTEDKIGKNMKKARKNHLPEGWWFTSENREANRNQTAHIKRQRLYRF